MHDIDMTVALADFDVVLRRPTTTVACPEPPSESDYVSVVMDACVLLQETDIVFRISGFGEPAWPVDISYDLSTFVEELPEVIGSLQRGLAAWRDSGRVRRVAGSCLAD